MLLDTSGLLCLHHRDETSHDDARLFYEASIVKVTHSLVLAEFVALAHVRRLPRLPALRFVVGVVENPTIVVVWVDQELHDQAMQLLQNRLDKTYSLCDAVSFLLMQEFCRGL